MVATVTVDFITYNNANHREEGAKNRFVSLSEMMRSRLLKIFSYNLLHICIINFVDEE